MAFGLRVNLETSAPRGTVEDPRDPIRGDISAGCMLGFTIALATTLADGIYNFTPASKTLWNDIAWTPLCPITDGGHAKEEAEYSSWRSCMRNRLAEDAKVFAGQRPGVSGSAHPAYDLADGHVRLAGQVVGGSDDGIQQGSSSSLPARAQPRSTRRPPQPRRVEPAGWAASGSPRQTLR
ncbi:hypothetical protein ACFWD7_38120 [Streptomyces mirabilis]